MHNTSVFFEEYKRLDHLCGDLFGSRAGVTAYLSQMERDTFEGRRIPNWDADYQMLKRFRHLRARLAHEECAFETLDISQRDIADIQAFHKRILSQNDPLALLEKKRHAHSRAENAPTAPVPTRSACARTVKSDSQTRSAATNCVAHRFPSRRPSKGASKNQQFPCRLFRRFCFFLSCSDRSFYSSAHALNANSRRFSSGGCFFFPLYSFSSVHGTIFPAARVLFKSINR